MILQKPVDEIIWVLSQSKRLKKQVKVAKMVLDREAQSLGAWLFFQLLKFDSACQQQYS